MSYRHFAVVGVLSLAASAVLSWMHVQEENSPLVFGPAFLGLGALISPLVFGGGEAGLRFSGRALLRSVAVPLAGAVMTGWGVLGAAGLMAPVSFDGALQHCRACKTNWRLGGPRLGRPHHVLVCEDCTRIHGAEQAAADLFLKICDGLPGKGEGRSLSNEVDGMIFADARVNIHGLRDRLRESRDCRVAFDAWDRTGPRLRVEVHGDGPVGTDSVPLKLRVALIGDGDAVEAELEARKTFPLERVKTN